MPLTPDEFDEKKVEALLRVGKREEALAYRDESIRKTRDVKKQGDIMWKVSEIDKRLGGKS